ncbi:isoleucine--tRNA ligase [Cuniculiplasma sp. SKW4]|uniref:isoleucine--tRNA ligase n=1 Tax=Cuniculiplasma sp. SKW4 TaxID=3400171 RepID=UPI003FD676ED
MAFELIPQGKKVKDFAEEISKYWDDLGVFQKIEKMRENGSPFIFLEGPPTANGRPHVGHALTRTIKDTALRYKTMMGYNIKRRDAGWDCHGLPVELEAEKHFGFKNKSEIEDFGVDRFNEYCKESVFRYIDEWHTMDKRLGFWINQDNAYITLRDDYIQSEWWAMKKMFSNGDLYKDFRISPYCPRCETTLSSHELAQGYKDVKDTSVYAKFKINDDGRYAIAWTTTPWTLPSNMLLAVNENEKYADVKYGNEVYIIASALVSKVLKENYQILRTYSGKELIGLKYERPISFIELPDNACRIVHGDHVNLTEGTGIVHTAPAFGSDDFELGKREGLILVNPVDLQGKFNDKRLPWYGKFVKDADIDIIKYLKSKDLVIRTEKYEHSYPFCYRCETPLLYYPIDAWFVRVSAYRKELVENNMNVNWIPSHLKEGRFGNFIEDAKDWNLSRNRYWGTPLPVWTCSCGHMEAIGSIQELMERSGMPRPKELHRPYVDEITMKCPDCGGKMVREPFVIDTWFDSGSSTYAATEYPFKGDVPQLPVSFITEAIDQTRGWFYVLHVLSTILFKTNAYSNVFCAEFILDSEGKKMSKSRGNGVLAMKMMDDFGPDASRLFFFTSAPWKPKPLIEKVVRENETKILGTLVNIYSFFASNANLDNYTFDGLKESSNILDKWLISRVNTTVKECRKSMDIFEFHDAQRLISDLIDDISNFYLRLSRRRFWELSKDKTEAYSTLFYSLDVVCRLLAPIVPFTSEYIYRKLHPDVLSVHGTMYPEPEENLIDTKIESKIGVSRLALELTRRARQTAGIKGRQPVRELLVLSANLTESDLEPVREEMNARSIKIISQSEKPERAFIKIINSKAAPILKSRFSEFERFIKELNESGEVEKMKTAGISFEGIEIPKDALEFQTGAAEGFVKESEGDLTIYLNTSIDQELEMEGLSREIIRRIQVMRKEKNLEYDEKIDLAIHAEEKIIRAVEKFRDKIMSETLAETINTSMDDKSEGRLWEIEDQKVYIEIM